MSATGFRSLARSRKLLCSICEAEDQAAAVDPPPITEAEVERFRDDLDGL